MRDAFGRGDLDEARRRQSLSIAMVDAIAATGFMGTSKALMEPPRRPGRPGARAAPQPERPVDVDALMARLAELGFAEWGAAAV